jgi:signal transduction histidine kinase
VWDNGKGMTKSQLTQNMQVFKKGQSSSGSGLGLAIVNEFSNTLELDFQIHSKPGQGSVAFLHLPIVR